MSVLTVSPLKKLWGENRHVHGTPTHSFHHATIRAGGYSSRHVHKHKHNVFYVVSGQLLVHVYPDEHKAGSISQLLKAGQQLDIAPGVWHRFEALTDVELIEIYYSQLSESDIHRCDEGGTKGEQHDHRDREGPREPKCPC